MIGLYLKAEDDPAREGLLDAVAAIVGRRPTPGETVVFTPNATSMSILSADAERPALSWLTSWPAGAFEAVAVSPGIRQLRSAWSSAFLDAINHSLAPGGTLVVALQRGGDAKGLWTAAWVESAIGGRSKALGNETIALGRGRGNDQPSVLRWFLEDAGRLMIDTLQSRLGTSDRIERVVAASANGPRVVPQRWDPATFDGFRVDAVDAVGAVHAFNYAVGGVGYKAPLIRHIIAQHMPGRRDLALLDVGGGTGVVAAELLLSEPAIAEATSCDPYLPHLALSQRLVCRFAPELAGRFRIAHATAEAMTYDRSYDVITFLGSLLYVPRASTTATLDAAWNALRPGGMLIVHENIRNERYERDRGHMFTAEELDGYLAPYGPSTYWLSTATARVAAADVRDRSVFRVHMKG